MASVIAFIQAHQQLLESLLLAVLSFAVGVHPAWDNSVLVVFLRGLLGGGGQPPAPPAPPAA